MGKYEDTFLQKKLKTYVALNSESALIAFKNWAR